MLLFIFALAALPLHPPPRTLDTFIPQRTVYFDVQCSSKVGLFDRTACYEGFFEAMNTWIKDAPEKARFSWSPAGRKADFTVFIGPEQIDHNASLVGEICWEKCSPRVTGKIYVTSQWPTASIIKAVCLHELGHLLGLDDSYNFSNSADPQNGWGVMGALDWNHPLSDPDPAEIEAVRKHK